MPTDIIFTVVIVVVSTALTGIFAAVIGGYLVLGVHPAAVRLLKWLYRWPLFIPFIVAAQCMRTFLAKDGMLNNTLDTLGLTHITGLSGLLDWRGIIVTFVWKETPFVALLLSGAMASLDRAGIEAARNIGASGLRILIEILSPQVAGVMTVGLIRCRAQTRRPQYRSFGSAHRSHDHVAIVGARSDGGGDLCVSRIPRRTNASLAGNYQIAAVTALILLVPSIAFMLLIERFLNTELPAKIG